MTLASPRIPWRSLLFVPVLAERFVAKATERGADAVVLDLEDSIPPGAKAEAREQVGGAIDVLAARGAEVLVRVNAERDRLAEDLPAVVSANLSAVVLPKVESADDIRNADTQMTALERDAGLAERAVGLIAVIEGPRGVLDAAAIAAEPRVTGVALGTEDFALATGAAPTPAGLAYPAQHLIVAARAFGKFAFVTVGHIREYENIALFEDAARLGKTFGSDGGFAIHPRQVEVLNRVFSPSDDEIAAAQRIVEAFDAALKAGSGAIAVDGNMIDAPIAEQARRVLARAAR
jgi:citrate lyase subunit beta/citryl-CoA lyase